jgi:UDPglucose 6-dehydrogenase
MNPTVSIVGLGKLGLGLATVFADAGFQTLGVDVNSKLVDKINAADGSGFEKDIDDLVRCYGGKSLIATGSHERAIRETDVTYILVATPSNDQGHFSNTFLEQAFRSLAESLAGNSKPYHLFVVGSTVTPCAIEHILIPLIESGSGRELNRDFGICYVPEFVALGAVVKGFCQPDLVIIGESDEQAGQRVEGIHRKVCRNSPAIKHMSIRNAEIAKVALNVFLTVKISFGNTIANLCERIPGADPDVIADAIGCDRRISPYYLRGGVSYGGPCFPRDTRALAALSRDHGYSPILVDATEKVNALQDEHLLENVVRAHQDVSGLPVGILGLSFKPDTLVITESASVKLAHALVQRKIPVVVFDPLCLPQVRNLLSDRIQYAESAADCVARSGVCVIANQEQPYKDAIERFEPSEPRIVLDCWRLLDRSKLHANLYYQALGLPTARRVPQAARQAYAPARREIDRVNILGVGVNAVNMQMALDEIEGWIAERRQNFVLNVPAHCIVECLRDDNLRKIYNRAGLVNPDGMPIAWIARWMGHRHVSQVCGPDLMLTLCERSVSKGYRHFLYGGWPPQVVEQLACQLEEKFPGIQIVGKFAPPFRPLTEAEDAEATALINRANPDIVWIGLGAAKEEFWAESHLRRLTAPALIGVGAAFDFHAGFKSRAPRWMSQAGLEWFFRVLTEPARLGPRYLKDNPIFVWNMLLQALGRQPRPLITE